MKINLLPYFDTIITHYCRYFCAQSRHYLTPYLITKLFQMHTFTKLTKKEEKRRKDRKIRAEKIITAAKLLYYNTFCLII